MRTEGAQVESTPFTGGFRQAPVPEPVRQDSDSDSSPAPGTDSRDFDFFAGPAAAPPSNGPIALAPPAEPAPAERLQGLRDPLDTSVPFVAPETVFAADPDFVEVVETQGPKTDRFEVPAAPFDARTFVFSDENERRDTVVEESPAIPMPTVIGVAETEAEESSYSRSSTEERVHPDDIALDVLLAHVLDKGASDLHLTTGAKPMIRLHGDLKPLTEYPELAPPMIQRIMYASITQRQREKFEEELELDFAYSVPGKARFRVNLYRQRDALGAAFRLIPYEIKKLEDLGIPTTVANFASMPRGFVLVTGPTGSGKSTTLASLVDLANRTRKDHIMTVEDPIEFLHRHRSCLVNQREVGEDTKSFANALKHVLRQDPDIILVGEMRDLETISVALTAAETGHLVFATLHTQDAPQTIDRVIDVFPAHQQQQIRVQLAGALQGVVCQTLCKTSDGRGRVVATEILTVTPAIRNLIREGKTHQIYSAMQAGGAHGMQTLDQHLADLVRQGRITYEHGLEKCHHLEDFNRLVGRG